MQTLRNCYFVACTMQRWFPCSVGFLTAMVPMPTVKKGKFWLYIGHGYNRGLAQLCQEHQPHLLMVSILYPIGKRIVINNYLLIYEHWLCLIEHIWAKFEGWKAIKICYYLIFPRVPLSLVKYGDWKSGTENNYQACCSELSEDCCSPSALHNQSLSSTT